MSMHYAMYGHGKYVSSHQRTLIRTPTNGADVNRIDWLGVRKGRHVNVGNTRVSALHDRLRLLRHGDLICSAEGRVRPKAVVTL